MRMNRHICADYHLSETLVPHKSSYETIRTFMPRIVSSSSVRTTRWTSHLRLKFILWLWLFPQAELPFMSKPKIQAPRKRKNLEQKRAVVLEPAEKKVVSLVSQLNAIRNQKAVKRREQQTRRRGVRFYPLQEHLLNCIHYTAEDYSIDALCSICCISPDGRLAAWVSAWVVQCGAPFLPQMQSDACRVLRK